MSAKIGILGESTSGSIGTTTVYTVPADKAARIRWMVQMAGGATNKQFAVHVGAPTAQTIIARAIASEAECWTGATISTNVFLPDQVGVQDVAVSWTPDTTTTDKDLVAPLAIDWYLSTGDTVKFTITNAAVGTMLFQVVGVEDDA